jgi:hypothetical protein
MNALKVGVTYPLLLLQILFWLYFSDSVGYPH